MVNSEIRPVQPFTNLIFRAHYDGDLSKIYKRALNMCYEQEEYILEKGGGRTTYQTNLTVLDLPECAELKIWLIEQSKLVWNLWKLEDLPRYASRSWFNWHPHGAWTDEHDHGMTHLVMAMYIHQPIDGGMLQVKDPLQIVWSTYPKLYDQRYDWRTIDVQTGDVVFFPGFLRHKTEINQSKEHRVVLSVNITADVFEREIRNEMV